MAIAGKIVIAGICLAVCIINRHFTVNPFSSLILEFSDIDINNQAKRLSNKTAPKDSAYGAGGNSMNKTGRQDAKTSVAP